MGRKKQLNSMIYYFVVIVIIGTLVSLLIIAVAGGQSNTIEVFGGGKTVGLKCSDSKMLHPALGDYNPISHTNTIMANFDEGNMLSSITLYYVGDYSSPSEAKQADAYAQADYGLILAKEYGVSVDSFSHSFMMDGNRISMTITAQGGDVADKTAPYFLLERDKTFPKTLDEMKERYENNGFTCEVIN